ncbi:MAG: SDR family NAD(P)-dependent oxidoreductase [Pseudomonadota bacterium]
MSVWKGIRFFVGKLPSFTNIGYQLRRFKWHELTLDFTGQTWVVTGASDGIGASIARTAALAGATVITVARSADKMNALQADVAARLAKGEGLNPKAKSLGKIVPAVCDLSDLKAIEALNGNLRRKLLIDVLINNVGILNNDHKVSADGFEMSYAVNLLGQHLLTERLLADGLFTQGGLIINMASGGLYNQPLNTVLLNQEADNFDGLMAYASHKRAQITLSDHWRRHGADAELFAYTMHPGWVRTSGVESSLPAFNKMLKPVLRTAEQAADTALWLAQKRPPTRDNVVWFDRKQRSPYLFDDTRTPHVTTQELLRYLNQDIDVADIKAPRFGGGAGE